MMFYWRAGKLLSVSHTSSKSFFESLFLHLFHKSACIKNKPHWLVSSSHELTLWKNYTSVMSIMLHKSLSLELKDQTWSHQRIWTALCLFHDSVIYVFVILQYGLVLAQHFLRSHLWRRLHEIWKAVCGIYCRYWHIIYGTNMRIKFVDKLNCNFGTLQQGIYF